MFTYIEKIILGLSYYEHEPLYMIIKILLRDYNSEANKKLIIDSLINLLKNKKITIYLDSPNINELIDNISEEDLENYYNINFPFDKEITNLDYEYYISANINEEEADDEIKNTLWNI